jgi:hypothetical protein
LGTAIHDELVYVITRFGVLHQHLVFYHRFQVLFSPFVYLLTVYINIIDQVDLGTGNVVKIVGLFAEFAGFFNTYYVVGKSGYFCCQVLNRPKAFERGDLCQ